MHRRLVVLAFISLALVACTNTPTVMSDMTPGANFSAYHSFSWVNAAPPAGLNPVAWERIRLDVESAMAAKGYTKADQGGDLAVLLTIGAQNKTDIQTYGYWGRQVSVYQYTEGQMSVDVFDAKTKQPLWHGQATQVINPGASNGDMIDKAVAQVMAKLPANT